MNESISETINYDYVTINKQGALEFDWQMLINNLLMLAMTAAMAYISKKFNGEIKEKQTHREVKMRRLDSYHQEKIKILKA